MKHQQSDLVGMSLVLDSADHELDGLSGCLGDLDVDVLT